MSADVRRARSRARGLLLIAFAIAAAHGLLWLAAPSGPTPMLYEPTWRDLLLPIAASTSCLAGLVWMIRIYLRSHLEPEPDEPIWRYRA